MSSVANPSTLSTFQLLSIHLFFTVLPVVAFGYNTYPFDQLSYTYEVPAPQNFQYGIPTNSYQDNQGTPQTSVNIMNNNGTWSSQDLQNVPTFQKNVYFTYRPLPPPPRRRRRLLPYFIFGFAAGSAAVLGGAAAATAFRG